MIEDKGRKTKPRELHSNTRVELFSQRLKDLRNDKKYSLNQLGMKVGLSKSTLAGYEGGYRFPSIDKLDVIAKVLETSSDYLLGLTDSARHKDGNDLHQYLDNRDLVYDGEPLTAEQIETLNNFLKTFILSNRDKTRDMIRKEIK